MGEGVIADEHERVPCLLFFQDEQVVVPDPEQIEESGGDMTYFHCVKQSAQVTEPWMLCLVFWIGRPEGRRCTHRRQGE